MTFDEAIDFFLNSLPEKPSEEDKVAIRATKPTMDELAAALTVAVNSGKTLKEAYEAAIVITSYWGMMEEE